jgi:hypothetical protein
MSFIAATAQITSSTLTSVPTAVPTTVLTATATSSLTSAQPASLPAVGLGLRREYVDLLLQHHYPEIGFLEFAPENWLPFGGVLAEKLQLLAQRYPLVCHGLSLNIGGPDALHQTFLADLAQFFQRVPVRLYSEHLSFTAAGGQLYDLLPLPFRSDAVCHVVERIKQVQALLQRPLVLENISYYTPVAAQMSELDFLLRILEQADCQLLLDVNNVYVNAVNHGYDPYAFIQALPSHRIAYCHVAGHYQQHETLLIDTHGSAVCDEVWQLLAFTYQCHGVLPTLLERDFNLPSLADLTTELHHIKQLQQRVR